MVRGGARLGKYPASPWLSGTVHSELPIWCSQKIYFISSTIEAGVGEYRFVDQQSLDVPSILYLKVLTKVKLSSGKIPIGEYCEYIF